MAERASLFEFLRQDVSVSRAWLFFAWTIIGMDALLGVCDIVWWLT